jgi:hypothetical protein
VPDDLSTEAISPQAPITSGGFQGYGWRISEERGETLLRHGGGVLGFRSSLIWNTLTGRASVVLVNTESDGVEELNLMLLDEA